VDRALNSPNGERRFLVLAYPLESAGSISSTAISVTAPNTITGVDFGFSAGDTVAVTGAANPANNGDFKLTSVTGSLITTAANTLVTEAAGATVSIARVREVRLSGGRFVSDATNPAPRAAPELLPHVPFDDVLAGLLTFERSMFSGDRIGGRSIPGFGQIELVNAHGGADDFDQLLWDGRPIWVLLGIPDVPYCNYRVVFRGVAARPEVAQNSVFLTVRDLQAILDLDIQSTRYSGLGAYEGGTDLTDTPKPLCWGWCAHVEPVPLGMVRGYWRYQFHDGGVAPYDPGWHAVYDRGIALTYTAGQPQAGQWTLDHTRGVITLGSTPAGTVSARVKGEADGGFVDAVGDIIRRIATTRPAESPALVDPDDIDGASFAAFHALALGAASLGTVRVGTYVRAGGNMLATLDQLAGSVGAYYGFDRHGAFQVGRVDAPGAPVTTITEHEGLEIQQIQPPPPVRAVTVGYRRNDRVLSGGDLAGSVSDNLISGGDFGSAGSWTIGAGWQVSGGKAIATATNADLTQAIAPFPGVVYQLIMDATVTAGSAEVLLSGSAGEVSLIAASTSGGWRVQFTAGDHSTVIIRGAGLHGDVDNIALISTVADFAANQYRTVTVRNRSILGTEDLRVDTLLIDRADAAAEAERLQSLLGAARRIWRVTAHAGTHAIDIGQTVMLQDRRWGLDQGRAVLVIAVTDRAESALIEVTLWG
jgi:hypothetical protein